MFRRYWLLLLFSMALAGCGSRPETVGTSTPTPLASVASNAPTSPLHFSDVTQQAGIKFKHNSGAFGLKLMPETMGSGVAFIDFARYFTNLRFPH